MSRAAVAVALVFGIGLAGGQSAAEPRIVATWTVPRVTLAAGVALGGLSDLAHANADGTTRNFWALTDRGPNGTVSIDGAKVRTLLAPDFVPAIVRLRLEGAGGTASVDRIVPLHDTDGRPLSGRPPGDDVLVDAVDHRAVASDPGGVDPEGLVAVADGSFWIAEEYRPALLHVNAEGTLLARLVPRGAGTTATDRDVLPAAYVQRRENRGFEALAATADGRRLWALLQSPLDVPGSNAGALPGNVRLLAVETDPGTPVAEYVYRLGDPADPAYLTRGGPPGDGKLCAMAALDSDTLLVLEQHDDGLARLYAADLAVATNTLDRVSADGATLEQVTDLVAAGIVPVRKTLLADLTSLRERMRGEADAEATVGGALKLEGLAIVDERTVAIVNDDDFGVSQSRATSECGTCVWFVELPADLTAGVAAAP